MLPYNPTAACPKCGAVDIATVFEEAKGWKGYDVHSCDGCCYTGGSVRYE